MMRPHALIFAGALLLLGGCTATRAVRGWFWSTSSFYQCTTDARIECQPGSEKLAQAILPVVEQAKQTVEKKQCSPFSQPIIIRTYATRDDFAWHSGAQNNVPGAVSFGVLHLSPRLLDAPEHIPGLVTHEFSHLNLNLRLGTWSWAKIPGWFHEGLATWVANGGGGAETVTREEAFDSIRAGHRFLPEDHGSPFIYRGAFSYHLGSAMYYRQAEVFVEYLHDINPSAFRQLLELIEADQRFSSAVEAAYGKRIDALFLDFLDKIR